MTWALGPIPGRHLDAQAAEELLLAALLDLEEPGGLGLLGGQLGQDLVGGDADRDLEPGLLLDARLDPAGGVGEGG